MKRKRRNHSPKLKAKVALDAIRCEKTLAQLAQQHEVHPNQITEWKQRLLASAEEVFSPAGARRDTIDAKIEALHAKIGELTVERDFLYKALGRDC